MRPDLENRKWAAPLHKERRTKPTPLFQRLAAAPGRVLVSEGYVMCKELGIKGSGRPIPPGESAITSLVAAGDWVYGATSGRRAHIFGYFSPPAWEVVADVTVLKGHTGVRHSLVWLNGQGLFAGTSAPGLKEYRGGEILKIGATEVGDVIQEWGIWPPEVKSLGIPVPGEGIACMIGDAKRLRLFGLSDRTGTLFSLDLRSRKMESYGPIDELQRFSPELILGPDGFVYGCGTAGRLLKVNPEQKTIQDSGLALPCLAGRGQYGQVGAWTLDERSGLIYAGDVADGLLSAINVRNGNARVLGKPTAQPHVRALAVAVDGRVYGVAGLRERIGHLFVYDPSIGEMRDLGVMTSASDRRWYGYEFDCAAVGQDGRIYFGESERVSHLFVYFPPLGPAAQGRENVLNDAGKGSCEKP
jgi:hypothetical protein